MCTRRSELHAHKVQFTKSTGVCLKMLIKNTHVVPAWAPFTAGRLYLGSRISALVKLEGDSTLCFQRLHSETWRLYSADFCFDPNIPLPGSYDSYDTWEMINSVELVNEHIILTSWNIPLRISGNGDATSADLEWSVNAALGAFLIKTSAS